MFAEHVDLFAEHIVEARPQVGESAGEGASRWSDRAARTRRAPLGHEDGLELSAARPAEVLLARRAA